MSRQHWYPAYVGLGSNLDDPVRQLSGAFKLLQGIPRTRLISQSSLYRSSPFGGVEQPDFVNAVAALLTRLHASELLQALQAIETGQGRVRAGVHWGPRILDLDLLVYSTQIIDDETLTVPHPGIAVRNFVLLPLGEIAPDLIIPGLGQVAKLAVDDNEPKISRIS